MYKKPLKLTSPEATELFGSAQRLHTSVHGWVRCAPSWRSPLLQQWRLLQLWRDTGTGEGPRVWYNRYNRIQPPCGKQSTRLCVINLLNYPIWNSSCLPKKMCRIRNGTRYIVQRWDLPKYTEISAPPDLYKSTAFPQHLFLSNLNLVQAPQHRLLVGLEAAWLLQIKSWKLYEKSI